MMALLTLEVLKLQINSRLVKTVTLERSNLLKMFRVCPLVWLVTQSQPFKFLIRILVILSHLVIQIHPMFNLQKPAVLDSEHLGHLLQVHHLRAAAITHSSSNANDSLINSVFSGAY